MTSTWPPLNPAPICLPAGQLRHHWTPRDRAEEAGLRLCVSGWAGRAGRAGGLGGRGTVHVSGRAAGEDATPTTASWLEALFIARLSERALMTTPC